MSKLEQYELTRDALKERLTKQQIIDALSNFPLGYDSADEHKLLEDFILHLQRYFIKLPQNWKPSRD